MSDVKYEMRYASHPADAKGYDTERLRAEYLFPHIMTDGEINLIYSAYDRLIVGGAVPAAKALTLDAIPPLRADRFLHRRELGIINVGGAGTVRAGDKEYRLDYKEALYLGKSERNVVFESEEASNPARFYFNSAPAHAEYPDRKITKADAVVVELGSLEESNHRVINKMIVNQVLPTCQLQMGMTELKPGSVWNTMPAHTHDRRMEAYFYFELPDDQAVCHFMGQPQETRHIWMRNGQAVISPQWSIHSACATHNYTFIWGMAGENMDYGDMDGCATTELK
ncbi:5-dehydro-4-deoxy-D-glucuronate isomerase [uncultured Rikenella sp.]|uniref:5-dehydro-4-deoxy-D-glucuronate isomerase n=1 Tax=uncultured Rikenella sp. TaxID=368003 RepID=UPI00261236AB|nr:5-dehydro-4-deoxy-D-glucuronate isomerase [uncultured Rikenella sp.]